jgi:SAM-dependent methyltransferase
MPTVTVNRDFWDGEYDWANAGDEWSAGWGGASMQWYATLLPRLHAFLPAKTILEIAPGFGRWTQYLHPLCEKLVAVDLSERCIAACRKRFSGVRNIEYHVNDGTSLDFVPDRSVDFVFSFDSLVHADESVMAAYLQQLARKLRPDGVGFIHHSNLGAHRSYLKALAMCPYRVKRALAHAGLGSWLDTHGRDQNMSAAKFETFARAAGMGCVSQELINWGGTGLLIDCISVFSPKASGPNRLMRNRSFAAEMHNARMLSATYGSRVR